MPFEDVFRKSINIQNRFLHLKEYRASKNIALYASFKNEVLTDEIMSHANLSGKNVYFPRVMRHGSDKGLTFLKVTGRHDFEVGSYEIFEPAGRCRIADIKDFDVVVVPGIAFNIHGDRIGYGKGYYDKVLSDLKMHALLVGIAFDFQVVNVLPVESHDVSMDMIITEKRIIKCKRVQGVEGSRIQGVKC